MTLVMKAWIPGRPVPQGSKVAMQPPNMRRPILKDSNAERLKPWRAQVTMALMEARRAGEDPLEGPVKVTLEFVFRRPKDHHGTGRNATTMSAKGRRTPWPCGRGQGDVDKLERAVLDGATDAGVWEDDSQVVELHARKAWGADEGVHVWIETMGGQS